MPEPFEALKKAIAADDEIDYCVNKEPKCPHCGESINISEHDLYHIQEEGEHLIDCPSCEMEFAVEVQVDYTFGTSRQPKQGA